MLRYFFTNDEEPTPVDELIETIMKEMEQYGPEAPEYTPLMEKLERLHALKLADKPKTVSRDTLAMGAFHILGILAIAIVERGHIFPPNAAKQLGRMMK